MQDEVFQRHARYISPSFVKLLQTLGYARVFVRAEGCHLYDDQGRRYLDLIAGYGSVSLGYNHPALKQALREALDRDPPSFLHVAPPLEAGLLAEALAARLSDGLEVSFFCNSGAEAVEGALKLAFAATRRTQVLYCHRSYHGLTLGALSVTGSEALRKFFPTLPGCEELRFGVLEGLEEKLKSKRYAALIVEPILIEGGVLEAPASYFQGLASLCRRYGTALIFDEVQTGAGRTGPLFAYQALGVAPDILIYAKGITGGLLPLGGFTTTRAWHERAYPSISDYGRHASTFGGNALSCVAARRALSLLDGAFLARSARVGAWLGERLRALRSPLLGEVRGRGLIYGLPLRAPPQGWLGRALSLGLPEVIAQKLLGHWVAVRLVEEGFVTETTTHDEAILRVEPALTITEEGLAPFVEALGRILGENERFADFVAGAGGRLLRQRLGGRG